MTVRLLPLIWIVRDCAWASPTMPKIDAARAMASAIARSRSQLPRFVVLSQTASESRREFHDVYSRHTPPPLRSSQSLDLPGDVCSVAAETPFSSAGTVYSCFADARVTTTVVVAALSVFAGSLVPKSFSVTLRVRTSAVSPALRSNSERLPTEDASHNFWASTGVDFQRDRLGDCRLGGALVGALIDREHPGVLQHDLSGGRSLFELTREHG